MHNSNLLTIQFNDFLANVYSYLATTNHHIEYFYHPIFLIIIFSQSSSYFWPSITVFSICTVTYLKFLYEWGYRVEGFCVWLSHGTYYFWILSMLLCIYQKIVFIPPYLYIHMFGHLRSFQFFENYEWTYYEVVFMWHSFHFSWVNFLKWNCWVT